MGTDRIDAIRRENGTTKLGFRKSIIKPNFVVPFSILIATILSVPMVTGKFGVALGQSADRLYKEAISADEHGDVSRAISLYEQLIKLQPDSVPVRSNLGAALARVGRYADAVSQYQEALKRDPKNSIVKINLALAWYKEGEFEKAACQRRGRCTAGHC